MEDKLKEFMEEPWWVITKSMADGLTTELIKELSPSHILYEKKAVAVARVSIDGKGSYTIDGKILDDKGLTHIEMNNDCKFH
jgi:TolB-like protein